MKKYVAAIDQGTTSTRCIIFDKGGNIVSMGQKEHEQIFPKPGWVEHNPEEIWKYTQEVIAQARIARSISVDDIAAVGITNQRETTVVWNRKSGRPYYNALVWQDTRTSDLVQHYQQIDEDDWFRITTGLPLATYFSALKLRWLLDNVPNLRRDAEKGDALFGNMDTYLIWHLTGGPKGGMHITDVTNASRTQLMNIFMIKWDDQVLERLNIPFQMLPRIMPSSHPYGTVTAEPLRSVVLSGDLGDQQAALVGQACLSPGEAKNTYGTGCFMLMNTGTEVVPSRSGLLTTTAYQFSGEPVHYALEGSVAIAGALVQWLRDNLGIIQQSSDIETLARTVTDNGGVYFVPAFSGLYAPYWKSQARGIMAGLTRYATKAHIARAALEATAFQTKEVLDAMERDSGIQLSSLRVDGGMVVNELLMQFQSDILGVSVIRPKMIETTALGAAYAAGLAVGFWTGQEDIKRNWGMDKKWEPAMPAAERERHYLYWQKAVERSFDWQE
ncbi:MAG: glycerol kinase GlpK [Saprospiraceae bacterium]|nr:glycerol kinase GlpK [Saprospiraceae bacterium]